MAVTIASLAFALFLLMDPLGNVPLFLSVLKDFSVKEQRKIILRELCIALVIIIGFYFVGDFLLELIEVQQHTILIAGGVILFLIAIKMIFPDPVDKKATGLPQTKDPFIVPLAIPFLAGPTVLAAVMLYSSQDIPTFVAVAAIVIAWIVSSIILLSSSLLKRIFGEKGLTAFEKLMGLILILIAIQMLLKGIALFVSTLTLS